MRAVNPGFHWQVCYYSEKRLKTSCTTAESRRCDGQGSKQVKRFVTLENIRTHYSRPRNELIARVLFNLGYVNTLGSGIPRMIRLMREKSGREPDFELNGQQFLARLWS